MGRPPGMWRPNCQRAVQYAHTQGSAMFPSWNTIAVKSILELLHIHQPDQIIPGVLSCHALLEPLYETQEPVLDPKFWDGSKLT